jgi:hypothetical protein
VCLSCAKAINPSANFDNQPTIPVPLPENKPVSERKPTPPPKKKLRYSSRIMSQIEPCSVVKQSKHMAEIRNDSDSLFFNNDDFLNALGLYCHTDDLDE